MIQLTIMSILRNMKRAFKEPKKAFRRMGILTRDTWRKIVTKDKYYYTENYYRNRLSLKDAYKNVSDILFDYFKPRNVIDFGCGNGFLLEYLNKRGCTVAGYEKSASSRSYQAKAIRKFINIFDVTEPLPLKEKYDLCICSEVAEHILQEKSELLVKNLIGSSDLIFFTAAPPGQGGTYHINCQQPEFWIKLFSLYDFVMDEESTKLLRARYRAALEIPFNNKARWFHTNLLIFRRKSTLLTRSKEDSRAFSKL